MRVITTISELRAYRASLPATVSVGFVPTMGALHSGHGSLVRLARERHDVAIVSVFCNPLQFDNLGDCDDYRNYPRDVAADTAFLEALGVDAVFAPSPEEMYPTGEPAIWVRTGVMGTVLEGVTRPGHFDGVATVVTKLFHLVQPQVAYFGQKDAQQVAILRRMVADLNIDVELGAAPIVRAADGLAESSRNLRLSDAERTHALALSQTLAGLRDGTYTTVEEATAALDEAEGVTVDYLTVVDPATLQPVPATTRPALALVAAYVGPVRLIDNMELD